MGAFLLGGILLGCASNHPSRTSQDPVAPGAAATATPSPAPTPAPVDFASQIRPLLEEKCTPCHFPGGRMYDRMPFDQETTIKTLGEAMLTRLRDPVDQELLRTFLAQSKQDADKPPAH